ncbi:E1 protein [Phocoena phocoena papillomavirus 2]|uniref:Replication protein E1 n=1 Tax=Phocoena phocoena papillomavirus 2 TaxID=706526 RepID=F2VIR3_9PAPI|nr:E1 protein [Phocoena phocoena papillomavirus 2]ADJ96348.1 E1 protein [Phocoena phocoena papillomavirus 2]
MDNSQGTDPLEGGSDGWVLVEARDVDGGEDDWEEDEDDLGEDLVDFIDDSGIASGGRGGVHRQLQTAQERADDDRALLLLKRKFMESPKSKVEVELSPRVEAISLREKRGRARRRLYGEPINDSGHGDSLEESSSDLVVPGMQVQEGGDGNCNMQGAPPVVVRASQHGNEQTQDEEDYTGQVTQLLRSGKPKAVLMALFRDTHGCSFTDLTRVFQSDKTICEDWVGVVGGVPCSLADAIPELLKPHVCYAHITQSTCKLGIMILFLIKWKTGKNRETVCKLLSGLLAVEKHQMILEPPRTRHAGAALFWYKKAMSNGTIAFGDVPQWILKQVNIQEQLGEQSAFSLSNMVQWAYDNDFVEECTIAYEYALLADEDKNAEAFLRSNNQSKHVKDSANMCKLYKRAEMKKMTMHQWIKHCSEKIEGDGDWKPILKFLKYQGIEVMDFIGILKQFLKRTPKKNCLVIYGPPDTGKSLFGMSFISMLQGKTISHVNSTSHFWLQPLLDCRVAMLDDATESTWDYFDKYLRNLLDGNQVCIDAKHKAPTQFKSPPLLITTNCDVKSNPRWKYLHSRLCQIEFPNPLPLTDKGDPVYELTKQNWKCFFRRCWAALTIGDAVQGGDNGKPMQPLRCAARETDGHS